VRTSPRLCGMSSTDDDASAWATAVLVGWGTKEGSRFKNWKRRLFVLRDATAAEKAMRGCTHMLAYYHDTHTVIRWKEYLRRSRPAGAVPITHGKTVLDVTERRIGGKIRPCILIISPTERTLCVSPELNVAEWVKTLSSLEPPEPPSAPPPPTTPTPPPPAPTTVEPRRFSVGERPVASVAVTSNDDDDVSESASSRSLGASGALPEKGSHHACVIPPAPPPGPHVSLSTHLITFVATHLLDHTCPRLSSLVHLIRAAEFNVGMCLRGNQFRLYHE
jgi:hypothetical protein